MIFRARRLRGAVVVAADIAALVTFVPDAPALAHHLAHADEWIAAVGADNAATSVAGAALWLCAVWLGLALTLIAVAGAPGWLGATGRRLTHIVVPAAAMRALAGIAGLSISVGAIGPAAALPPSLSLAVSSSPAPAPAWPTSPAVPSWPTTSTPSVPSPGDQHLVVPGDCLWDLAANQIGPTAQPQRILAGMRAWYAANRAVIGPDPALLHPGELLVEPGRTP